MPVDQAKAFIERMKNDEAFRARVLAEEDVAARMALIAAEGFDRSAEEIGSLQELGETELDGVAGVVKVLLTPEEIDKSARTEMWYRPPGT
jgi:predicted ribosomally synthesized peptide with nif11-like leader